MDNMKLGKKFLERHKKMQEHDKLYGTSTMGARGQVVIPAKARVDLSLKPGDQLIVMGKFGRVLGLMKADELENFIDFIMDHVAGTPAESFAKKKLESFFGPLKKAKKKK